MTACGRSACRRYSKTRARTLRHGVRSMEHGFRVSALGRQGVAVRRGEYKKANPMYSWCDRKSMRKRILVMEVLMSSDRSRRRFLASTAATAVAGLVAVPRLSGLSASSALLASLTAGDSAGGAVIKPNADWKDQGVLALGRSPYAKLQSVPVHAVTIEPGFWSKRRTTNVQASIPTMRQELVEHGRMDNFLRLKGKSNEYVLCWRSCL